MKAGQRLPFVFTWHPSHEPMPRQIHAETQLAETEAMWKDWVGACTYQGPWREAVVRSLITLKALTYAPTGGIVAAPTTSLPEDLGGVRNWDYRYCWLRDATMTLDALIGTGYLEEADAWRTWLLRAIAGRPQDLQIMYGVAGERRLPELELDWLAGYEGSRPVRIGNAGRQPAPARRLRRGDGLPVPGAQLRPGARRPRLGHPAAAARLRGGALGRARTRACGRCAAPRRHFVHSKMMCWVAFDRAVK